MNKIRQSQSKKPNLQSPKHTKNKKPNYNLSIQKQTQIFSGTARMNLLFGRNIL